MTPGEQLDALRRARAWPHRSWWAPTLLAVALLLTTVALYTGAPSLLVPALLGAVFAWALERVDTHRVHAIAAAQGDARSMARINVTASGRGTGRVWRVVVLVDMLSEWGFEFVPDAWAPAEGTFMAEICFAPGVAWPALVLTEHGVLYPCNTPQRRIPR